MLLAALGCLFGVAFALPRPDALSPHSPYLLWRRIIPDDVSIPSSAVLAYRGGAMRYSPEFVEWAFSEVKLRFTEF
jgi:hypothetical protein